MKWIVFNDKRQVVESCLTKLDANYLYLAIFPSGRGTVTGGYSSGLTKPV